MPRLCELYPGICLITEEKTWKSLSQGSRRMPVGTMKTGYTEQSIQDIGSKAWKERRNGGKKELTGRTWRR